MDAHQNARTPPHSRQLIVARLAQGSTVSAVVLALGIDPKTVRKWRDRFVAEGAAGLADRSSRPHTSPTRVEAAIQAEIAQLRRERLPRDAHSSPNRTIRTEQPPGSRAVQADPLNQLDPKPDH